MARPWYPWYAADYARVTSHLTFVEDAAYRRMLDHYYSTGRLPAIAEILLRVCCAFADDEKAAVLKIKKEFFREVDGFLVQDRVEEELSKTQYLSGIRREIGKRGAAKTNSKNPASHAANSSANAAANIPAIADTTTTTTTSKQTPTSSLRSEVAPLVVKSKRSKAKITFADWRNKIKASGEKAISDYQPVLDYVRRVGIPSEWIEIAWTKFKERYSNDPSYRDKAYLDWRKTFLNAVEGNWFSIWYAKDGVFSLTTVGQQAELSTREAA